MSDAPTLSGIDLSASHIGYGSPNASHPNNGNPHGNRPLSPSSISASRINAFSGRIATIQKSLRVELIDGVGRVFESSSLRVFESSAQPYRT